MVTAVLKCGLDDGGLKVALRVLGMFTDSTKYPIEALLHRHAVALADRLLRTHTARGAPASAALDPYSAIESAVVAAMFELCFGDGGGDDELYSEMLRMLQEMRAVMPAVQSVDVMPWLAPCLRRPLNRYSASLQRSHRLTADKVRQRRRQIALTSKLTRSRPYCPSRNTLKTTSGFIFLLPVV